MLAIRYADDANGESGDVLWRLGPGGSLTLEGQGELQYHQHAPEVQPDGTILLYDNGNDRPGTDPAATDPAGRPYSRTVRYAIDDDAEHRHPGVGVPLDRGRRAGLRVLRR